jgi:hypothetical protein
LWPASPFALPPKIIAVSISSRTPPKIVFVTSHVTQASLYFVPSYYCRRKFSQLAQILSLVAHKERIYSRQVAKFGILFSYLGAFASLREVFRRSAAAVPRWKPP